MRITSMNSQQDKRMAVYDVFHGPRTYLQRSFQCQQML